MLMSMSMAMNYSGTGSNGLVKSKGLTMVHSLIHYSLNLIKKYRKSLAQLKKKT